MAESTPITPPSGFTMVCNYNIVKPEDGGTKEGRILKNAFKNCPSPSVKKYGEVTWSETFSNQQTEPKPADNNQSEQKPSQPTDNSQSEQSKDNSTRSGQESYNYSMLNAYLNLDVKSEADDNQSQQSTQQSNANKSQAQSSGTDKSDTDEKKWYELYVETLLPKEGCTIWHIAIDKSADIESVTKAIVSKDFKAAYTIASKNSEADGIVVLSAKTYLNSKAECGCPFMGFCNYALDVGGDEGSEDEAISLAVAPFDARTGKPAREIVYKVTYNVTGDIMGGVVNTAKAVGGKVKDGAVATKNAIINKDTDSNNDKQKDDETPLSKWLHKQQKCVGDKEMYGNYNKLRKFINDNVSKKLLNLSASKEDTETVESYSKVDAVKNSLIIY